MKKLISLLLALAMILSLAVPALAAEPTITGDKEGDVTANYTPVIKITDIVLSEYDGNGSVTVDAENKTYTVTVPANADSTVVTITVKGQNLDKITEGDYMVCFRHATYDPLSADSYDPNTGTMSWSGYVHASGAGTDLKYSTDGGETWTETGWSVVVEKEAVKYNVTVNAAENGTVTASSATAAEGETVGLFVSAAEGYELDALTVMQGQNSVDVAANHTFVMPAGDVAVTATFKAAEKAYNITINESENGTVAAMVGEQQVNSAHHNDDVTLVVTPDDGYRLSSLTVTYVDANGETKNQPVTDSNTFVMPGSEVTVTAVFEAITAEITGMSIIIDGKEYNSTNTSEIAPAEFSSTTQSLILKVTGTDLQYNEHALASYLPTKNSDPVRAADGWTISADGTSATRDIGEILDILGATGTWQLQYANDGNTLIPSGVYVKYQAPSYAVNISTSVANGTVTAAPNPAEAGETVTVTVEAEAGYAYVVNSLKVTNDTTGEAVTVDEATKSFVMPASTVTVTAEFEKLTVTSANISWGSMAFTYTDEAGAWTTDGSEGAGSVTVTNTGDTTFSAQPSYTAEADYDEITAKFYESENPDTPTTMGYPLASEESITFLLKLFNQPEKAIPAGTKIGSVTITITEGSAS